MASIFDSRIEFLKGVGPQKGELFNKELSIFTYGDLLQHYPFRHEDRTRFYKIKEVSDLQPFVQIKGIVTGIKLLGEKRSKRLVATLVDDTGQIELVWFKGIKWVQEKLRGGVPYLIFGKATKFGSKYNIAHPEFEPITPRNERSGYLQPIYYTSEKLKARFLDSKAISKMVASLLKEVATSIPETLPEEVRTKYKLVGKKEAIIQIHFPPTENHLLQAKNRLKFEEFFYMQIRLLKQKLARTEKFKGIPFTSTELVTEFYKNHLPFELTNAQKRVIREAYSDMRSGKQMNRLLQGDVGSGKTVVAFICCLIAISAKTQAALMAPTEILAEQHYKGLQELAQKLNIEIALLTGSSKKSHRKEIHNKLLNGDIKILIGTHALLEDTVQFKKLGLAVVDEQHRFGVAQRAKLWKKNKDIYPHMLVMTATPIPRTLAMTLYGDLDVSVIDELPAGRKPIDTVHRTDSSRLKVFGFIKQQIKLGRQVYIVYPLIEESEHLEHKDLMDGYESVSRAFPEIGISIVHGRMKSDDKEKEMQRFVKGQTKILVATTVIEVGVNVPNASVMVIENAERFGLAQLHQLRGRVGRGAEQSYCILMTGHRVSKEGKERIKTLVRTNNGFEIAETDLRLRGPGDLTGTQQSGVLDLIIADIARDGKILEAARSTAKELLEEDPTLELSKNILIKKQIDAQHKNATNWGRIS